MQKTLPKNGLPPQTAFSKLLILSIITLLFLFHVVETKAQKIALPEIKISGKIVDKVLNQPLEYATITLINAKNPKAIFGGITDNKGEFNVEAAVGMYTVKIEFISYNPQILNGI